ncbi:2-amino-4-oxopentanoate thiolase subunit OrtA [Methylomarinum sp. Ch1-1]|uniref:2-amino-4-oxopentanoate thiolase subunit OrtA n=1 Tax=Methylomarinum roseum TaxID=3067653 RepID=A0AAU7NQD4_9GAMM|nr:2-amino-4-oxopentanoate thiolase subunit OrtA [Methylomarinum sp. Ch1-1]MDP4520876.1 2-amino-4-oxopentanoate thiolase subunit OrtA [Methylomarinum sp. Ch1-1]
MTELIDKGVWVEIHTIVLHPGERAPQIPEDTAKIPLEMRVKGFLIEPARLGDQAQIVTAAGRRLRGRLDAINPAYRHGFGAPIPELSTIGQELRALLAQQDADDA